MPQLVGIAHDVDRRDLAILDLERGRLQLAVALARDEPRQAIDHARFEQGRRPPGEQRRERSKQLQHAPVAGHRNDRGRAPAAAIGVERYVAGEQGAERGRITAARSGEECLRQRQALLAIHRIARPGLPDVGPRPGGQLAAGGFLPPQRLGYLAIGLPEHVVQQEGRALERREPFQREHQRQGDILGLFGVQHRVGQPRADIGLAPPPCRFQLVEAQARHRAPQERPGRAHRGAIGRQPAKETFLHRVFRVGDRTEHAIGDP